MNRPVPLTPAVRALEVGRAEYLIAANQTAAIAASWQPTFTAATERRQKATATRRSKSPQPARARADAAAPFRELSDPAARPDPWPSPPLGQERACAAGAR